MPSPTEITVAQLSRLVGLPGAPVLADVHSDQEFKSDPRLIPPHDGTYRRVLKAGAEDMPGHPSP